jgi:hypothetical protein
VWIAFVIAVTMTGDVVTDGAVVASEKECVELNAKAEAGVKANKMVRAYKFECVEAKKLNLNGGLDV